MMGAVKGLALQALTAPPLYGVLHARALRENPATILCYHTLRPQTEALDAWVALGVDDFRAQIAMLRDRYEIVSLDAARAPATPGGRPRAVLTFDDGEIGLHSHLLPIIIAENLPVTIYVATAQIETGKAYWFDRVMNALQEDTVRQITLAGHGSWQIGRDKGKARWAQINQVLEALKQAPTQTRDALADDIGAQVADSAAGFTPLQPMTLAQLQEVAAHPCVTIGAHSHGHELLNQLPLDAARDSIARSRDLLREWTGQPVVHFAYPNGNHTAALGEVLKTCGFQTAAILGDQLAHDDADAMALPRISVGRYDRLARLKLRLAGI
jgi:peptidoglycan/xylan/chitin deacetylase (PgdA/CDA1 family)